MLCGSHFPNEDYKSAKRCYLKEDAVPSIFKWSRKPPAKRTTSSDEKSLPSSVMASTSKQAEQTCIQGEEKSAELTESKNKRDRSPSKDELKLKVEEQKKKIKNLQQQVRREKKKTKTLAGIIDDLKTQGLVNADTCACVRRDSC